MSLTTVFSLIVFFSICLKCKWSNVVRAKGFIKIQEDKPSFVVMVSLLLFCHFGCLHCRGSAGRQLEGSIGFQPECSGNLPKVSSLNLFLSLNCFERRRPPSEFQRSSHISHRIEDFEMTLNSSISLVNYLFIPAQTFFVLPIW